MTTYNPGVPAGTSYKCRIKKCRIKFKNPFSSRWAELSGLRPLLSPNLAPLRDSKGIKYELYQQNQDLKIDSTYIEPI